MMQAEVGVDGEDDEGEREQCLRGRHSEGQVGGVGAVADEQVKCQKSLPHALSPTPLPHRLDQDW